MSSCVLAGVTGTDESSAIRRRAVAAVPNVSPDQLWAAVNASSATVSANGSPVRSARSTARRALASVLGTSLSGLVWIPPNASASTPASATATAARAAGSSPASSRAAASRVDRVVLRREPHERAGEPVGGGGGRRQVLGGAGGIPRPAGGLPGRTMQAEHVIAEHPAPGHPGGVPERRGLGGGVAGERGRLFVPLLGLAEQVAGEGQLGHGQGKTVRFRPPLQAIGRPGQGGPEVVDDRVEPGSPVHLGASPEDGRAGQAPAQVPGARLGQLAALDEPLGPVLADGLQRLVPGAAADIVTASRLCSASRANASATAAGSTGANPATSAADSAVNGATNTDTRRSSARSAGSSRS